MDGEEEDMKGKERKDGTRTGTDGKIPRNKES